MVKKLVCVVLASLLLSGIIIAAEKPLQVWIRAGIPYPPANEWIKSKVEEWAQKRGVKVEASIIPDYILDEKLIQAMETGETPDVIFDAEFGVSTAVEKGLAVPLDDVVERIGKDDFYEAALNLWKLEDPQTGEEHIYAIPLFLEWGYWYIRTDLAEKAGVEIPEHPTLSWLIQYAYAVNDPPRVYGLGIPISPSYDALCVLAAFLYDRGGGFLTEPYKGGADIFNSKPTWELFADLQKWYKDKIIPPDAVNWTDSDNNIAYMEGRIASTYNPGSIMAAMGPNHPLTPYTKMLSIPPVPLGGECTFIFRSNPEREALAKDLVYYIASDKKGLLEELFEKAGGYGVPVFKSTGKIVTQKYKEGKDFPYNRLHGNPIEILEKGEIFIGAHQPFPYGKPTSVFQEAAASFQITSMMAPLFIKNVDPRKVAADIASWLNSRLPEKPKGK